MSEVDRRNVELLQQEYEQQVANLAEMQQRMTGISATAVSPRRELSVTVGHQGVITEMKFLTSGYRRMAKNELADLVTRTIAEAREKAMEQTAQLIAPLLPPGLDAKELVSGAGSAEVVAPKLAELPPLVRERMDRRGA